MKNLEHISPLFTPAHYPSPCICVKIEKIRTVTEVLAELVFHREQVSSLESELVEKCQSLGSQLEYPSVVSTTSYWTRWTTV